MKFIQKKFLLVKSIIDFEEVDSSSTKLSGDAGLKRFIRAGSLEEDKSYHVVDVLSEYKFNFSGKNAEFKFLSRFEVSSSPYSDELLMKKIDDFPSKEIFAAIVNPQEVASIKTMLLQVGVNIRDGLIIGEEFELIF